MNGNMWMQNIKQRKNYRKLKNDIDDSTFVSWKSELLKSLPSFWESMV